MFRYVPDMFKGEYAETEEEGKRWVDGDKTARRPPELLTRDVVAKAILAEVKAGRGTPHGELTSILRLKDLRSISKRNYHRCTTNLRLLLDWILLKSQWKLALQLIILWVEFE